MNHPLRNFQRGPTWSSNNDPLVARNRIMDDLQFLPGIRMKSIVDRDSGTIGILECCSITTARRRDSCFWTLRDPLIRQLTLYRDLINAKTQEQDYESD